MTKGEQTKKQILDLGVKLWPNQSMRDIAKLMKPSKSHTAIAYHFDTHDKLRKAIIKHAIETGASKVIAYLIVTNDPAIKKMSAADRAKHMKAAT